MSVTFSEGTTPNQVVLERSLTIEEVQTLNQAALKRAGTAHKRYRSGDGWRAHVLEKYGKHK